MADIATRCLAINYGAFLATLNNSEKQSNPIRSTRRAQCESLVKVVR